MLQLTLLDAPRLAVGGRSFALGLRDAALLAWLLREGPAPRAELAALLWPALAPADAAAALRQRVFRLRRLGMPPVVAAPGSRLALADGVLHDLAPPLARVLAGADPWAVGDALLGRALPPDAPALAAWIGAQREAWRRTLGDALLEATRRARDGGAPARALPFVQRAAALRPADAETARLLQAVAAECGAQRAGLAGALAALQARGLDGDVMQLLDGLWLSTFLPAPPAPPPAPVDHDAADGTAGDAGAAARAPATGAGSPPAAPPGPPAGVRHAPGPAADDAGVYPRVAPGSDADAERGARRARGVRVAGARALREPQALARALLPLAKRRPSSRRQVLDEVATAEAFADTGVLVPVMAGLHERGFDATLLVEDGPAMPLWRTLANELETLLARQGGFRRFTRYTLVAPPGAPPLLRLQGATAMAPQRLAPDGGASLVLVATDGTGAAWADGRHAAMLAMLGRRHSLALLQWMPERLWPHTALGAAEGALRAPRAGAPNAALQLTRPGWLGDDEAVLALPLLSLRPASFDRLARLLTAKPGAACAAALLFPPADDAAPAPTPAGASAPTAVVDAATRITRFRSVATPRLMQVAVQLSAAAPLTLPVVRLVHRVMQPDAPAEDLPLLLLGGLLERRGSAARDPGAARDDNDVVFDFAPGVREALQPALLKSEADAVRRAVARHIAERSGGVLDFRALLLDAAGDVALPDWARPFADVSQQVQALFPRSAPPAAPAPTMASFAAPAEPAEPAEPAWAPGVRLQTELRLPAAARALAWSPDGTRLAVLHAHGLRLLRTVDAPAGPRGFERLPQALRATAHLLVVKGTGLSDGVMEAALAALRDGLNDEFRGGWRFTYHTVEPSLARPGGRAPAGDVRSALTLALKPEALVVFVGDEDFARSPWMREADSQSRRLFAERRGALWRLTCTQPAANPATLSSWRIQSADDRTDLLAPAVDAAAGGAALARAIGDAGAQAVPEVAFGADSGSIAWDGRGDLLLADAARRRVLRERDLHQMSGFPEALPSGARPRLLCQPGAPAWALADAAGLFLHTDGSPPWERLDGGHGAVEAAWSPDGSAIAVRDGSGLARSFDVSQQRWTLVEPIARHVAGPAWQRSGQVWFGSGSGEVIGWDGSVLDTTLRRPGAVQAVACSRVDGLVAAAWHDGSVVVGHPSRGWSAPFELPEAPAEGMAIQLAFMPPTSDEGSGTESLAVACGDGLWLLRIDAHALALSPAAAEASPDAGPSAAEVVAAALAVLQSLALAFHVGAFAPRGSGSTRERYARRLGIEAGTPADATLLHLVRTSEYVFRSRLKPVLDGAIDPLARPDPEAGLKALARELDRLGDALAALGFGLSTEALPADEASRHDALRTVQRGLALLTRTVRRAAPDARERIDAAFGADLAGFLASLAPLGDAGLLTADGRVFASRVPLLNALASSLVRLRRDELQQALAVAAAQAEWLRADEGESAFADAQDIADYAGRLVGALAEAAGGLLQAADAPPSVKVEFPIDEVQLETVAELAEAAGCRPGAPTERFGEHEVAGWPVAAERVVPLLRLVGAIVVTALAWRTGRPLPEDWAAPGARVLWVDDQPDNNRRWREQLARRALRVELAGDTGDALERLARAPAFDAVLTDMGRPPDARAGYTLLDAMRARGIAAPCLIFSSRQTDDTRAEARRRGAAGSTDRFDELETMLRDALFAPPGTAA